MKKLILLTAIVVLASCGGEAASIEAPTQADSTAITQDTTAETPVADSAVVK